MKNCRGFTHKGQAKNVDRQKQAKPRRQQSRSQESPREETNNEDGTMLEFSGKYGGDKSNRESIWSCQLSTDMQKLIVQRLPTLCKRFRAVCREWRSLVLLIRWQPKYYSSGTRLMFPTVEKGRFRGREQISNKQEETNNEDGSGTMQEIISGQKYNSNKSNSESIWSQLPTDVQKLIVQRLPAVFDYMRFRVVCREWRSLVLPIRWQPNYSGTPFKHPWLMFPTGEKGKYKSYDPIGNLMHCITIPDLEGCEVRFSKQGWLLVTKAPTSIFFFEPFTRTRIQLPDLMTGGFVGFCFSDPPTSSNWHIFGIRHVNKKTIEIWYLQSGDVIWTLERISSEGLPSHSFTNPYCYDSGCCYLGNDGRLLCFKFTAIRTINYRVFSPSSSLLGSTFCRKFLVGHGDGFIAVCVDEMGKTIDLVKLEFEGEEYKCVLIKSLEEKALYLSQTTSLCVEGILEQQVKNTIQFSMFNITHNNSSNISYSLNDKRYQFYDSDAQVFSSLVDLYNIEELLSGFWIQPLVVPQIVLKDV